MTYYEKTGVFIKYPLRVLDNILREYGFRHKNNLRKQLNFTDLSKKSMQKGNIYGHIYNKIDRSLSGVTTYIDVDYLSEYPFNFDEICLK